MVYTLKEFAELDLSQPGLTPAEERARFIKDGEAHLATVEGEWVIHEMISVKEVREHLAMVTAGDARVEDTFQDWLFNLMLDRGGGLMPGRRR